MNLKMRSPSELGTSSSHRHMRRGDEDVPVSYAVPFEIHGENLRGSVARPSDNLPNPALKVNTKP